MDAAEFVSTYGPNASLEKQATVALHWNWMRDYSWSIEQAVLAPSALPKLGTVWYLNADSSGSADYADDGASRLQLGDLVSHLDGVLEDRRATFVAGDREPVAGELVFPAYSCAGRGIILLDGLHRLGGALLESLDVEVHLDVVHGPDEVTALADLLVPGPPEFEWRA